MDRITRCRRLGVRRLALLVLVAVGASACSTMNVDDDEQSTRANTPITITARYLLFDDFITYVDPLGGSQTPVLDYDSKPKVRLLARPADEAKYKWSCTATGCTSTHERGAANRPLGAAEIEAIAVCSEKCATSAGGRVDLATCGSEACDLLYTPRSGYAGDDTFAYHVCVKEACDLATVTVTVLATTLTMGRDVVRLSEKDTSFDMPLSDLVKNDNVFTAGELRYEALDPTDVEFATSSSEGGTVTYDEVSRTITYLASEDAVEAEVDSFTYSACHDGDTPDPYPCGTGTVVVSWRGQATTTTTPPSGGGGWGGAPPDPDADGDTVADSTDNCVNVANTNQLNTDGANDGGDACDTDDDNDAVLDLAPDNCPTTANAGQDDNHDADGIGDACDDSDADTVFDLTDNCPSDPNTNQANVDLDFDGDVCDLLTGDGPLTIRAFDGNSFNVVFPHNNYGVSDLVEFTFVNQDPNDAHNVSIDIDGGGIGAGDIDVDLAQDGDPGDESTITVSIPNGTYQYFCNLHFPGMQGSLDIT